MSELLRDIKYIKGIGEKRAQLLNKRLGLFTLEDLVNFFPRSYLDLSNPFKICDIPMNEQVCIKAKIATEIEEKVTYNKNITTYTFYIYDRTGQIKVVIFNNKYLANSLEKDKEYLFYGKVKWNGVYREFSSPEIRNLDDAKLCPVYKSTAQISSKVIERIMPNALALLEDDDFIPKKIIDKFSLLTHLEAMKQIHFPENREKLDKAIHRLAFEELFLLRLGFLRLKSRNRGLGATPLSPLKKEDYTSLFPFELTKAQGRVINECLRDMTKTVPMNRLVQGDVGSGKTAVAAALCYTAYKNGYMSVMLAPTEILATQHFETLSKFLSEDNLKISLLTGSLTPKAKRQVKKDILDGKVNILVATHAVLTDDTMLPKTALVITDEQHRFGVSQRAALTRKANSPHTLVMSATPIPRTMGLIIYGDLDISIIDELPKGRIPINSYYISDDKRNRALNFVKKHLDDGYQGYIVCPMIEENEEFDEIKSATGYFNELKEGIFKDYPVGLLHGKMKPKEKEAVMQDFINNKIKLLVSTTVIEVGVDVPNAVIMVIENAERFGLSQLHQLRGRIGRGNIESTCIFISNTKNENTEKRLKTICSTTDGFKIAEADLLLRGPGNFLGKEQHGLPNLKFAEYINSSEILNEVSLATNLIFEKKIDLSEDELLSLNSAVEKLFTAGKNIEFN